MKFAIRLPANFLYRSITSPWEAEVTPEDSLEWVEWLSHDIIPAFGN